MTINSYLDMRNLTSPLGELGSCHESGCTTLMGKASSRWGDLSYCPGPSRKDSWSNSGKAKPHSSRSGIRPTHPFQLDNHQSVSGIGALSQKGTVVVVR
jgi:hypothetical protein